MDAYEVGIDVVHVLESLLSLEVRIQGNEAIYCCPNPNHPDENPSFSTNLVTGFSYCFSCGFKADLVGIVSVVLNKSYKEAEKLVLPGAKEGLVALLQAKLRKSRERDSEEDVERHLPGPYEKGPLDYMFDRGLTRQTCKEFGVRYTHKELIKSKSGSGYHIQAVIAIPIYDRNGKVGWVYRSTDQSPPTQPRYLYLGGTPIGKTWYGSQLVDWDSRVVVVEGPLDTMWVHQAGYQALGCMGSQPNPEKMEQLKEFDEVVILPDKDPAGILFMKKMGNLLNGKVRVSVARYPSDSQATDPCELTKAQVITAVEHAIPFHAWKIKQQLARSA